MIKPDFLSLEDVLLIHRDQIQNYGGIDGLRNKAGLLSAIAQPEATWDEKYLHPDLFSMAAAYAFHLSENQPFLDGNKRTGLAAALVFLELNGIEIKDPHLKLAPAVLMLSGKRMTKSDFAELLRGLAGTRKPPARITGTVTRPRWEKKRK